MSKTNVLVIALCFTLALTVTGCETAAPRKEPTYEEAAQEAFIRANHTAAQTLLELVKPRLSPEQPLIVATLVDINELEKSSPMGRMIAEQISGVFTRAGYRMIEMKFRNNVYVKRNEGELALTREISDIATQHRAQAVIVGTYTVASRSVFINLKVVQPNTDIVLAAHDYALPLDANLRAMLARAIH